MSARQAAESIGGGAKKVGTLMEGILEEAARLSADPRFASKRNELMDCVILTNQAAVKAMGHLKTASQHLQRLIAHDDYHLSETYNGAFHEFTLELQALKGHAEWLRNLAMGEEN